MVTDGTSSSGNNSTMVTDSVDASRVSDTAKEEMFHRLCADHANHRRSKGGSRRRRNNGNENGSSLALTNAARGGWTSKTVCVQLRASPGEYDVVQQPDSICPVDHGNEAWVRPCSIRAARPSRTDVDDNERHRFPSNNLKGACAIDVKTFTPGHVHRSSPSGST